MDQIKRFFRQIEIFSQSDFALTLFLNIFQIPLKKVKKTVPEAKEFCVFFNRFDFFRNPKIFSKRFTFEKKTQEKTNSCVKAISL